MPKVTINEIDQSRYVASTTAPPMVVLVPGTASFGPVFDELNPAVTTFSGAAGLQNFYKTFGYGPATVSTVKPGVANDANNTYQAVVPGDISFEYVTNLLNNGATVQFVRINEGLAASTNTGLSIESDPEVGTSYADFRARYSGRFGNYLAVKVSNIEKQDDGNFEAVITVLMARPKLVNAHTSETDATKLKLNTYTVLEAYRVSSDPTSIYYSSLCSFDYLSNISVSEFIKIVLDVYNKDNSTAYKVYPLFGGYDFATDDPVISGATAQEITDTDEILNSIYEKLAGSGNLCEGSVYNNFTDPYLFDFDFVTSGGLINAEVNKYDQVDPIHKAMYMLCQKRGDCIALLDTPKTMSAYNAAVLTNATDAAPTPTVSSYASKIDTSYAAIYAPWCSVVSSSTAAIIDMPPSYIFMSAILKGMSTSVNNDLWYVPAGVTRAAAPFIISPRYEIGSVILDEFQNNHNYRVNPIMRVRNYGYCIYGNSTCQKSIDGVGRSALESMNVRLIANVIKKTIFAVCSALAFEYNDSRLWAKFYSQMDKVLIYMKRNYGLYDYKIIMDNSTVTSQAMNERRVPGKIMISPTLAGEYFDIDFEISPSGVSFSEEA